MDKLITDESRRKYIKDIIAYFYDERNEEIGVIAAENILDFFLNGIGREIYNKGIIDIKELIKDKYEELETELDLKIEE
jgi:uncharacterized protein (DUF2164 family)